MSWPIQEDLSHLARIFGIPSYFSPPQLVDALGVVLTHDAFGSMRWSDTGIDGITVTGALGVTTVAWATAVPQGNIVIIKAAELVFSTKATPSVLRLVEMHPDGVSECALEDSVSRGVGESLTLKRPIILIAGQKLRGYADDMTGGTLTMRSFFLTVREGEAPYYP